MRVTSSESSNNWGLRLALALAVFAPLCQWAVGAKFGPTGQQLTAGLPLPTLALLAAILVLLLAGEWRLPFLSWAQLLLLGLVSMGLLGLARQEWRTGAKELVQLVEIAVLAPFAFRALHRRLGLGAIASALAVAFVGLLVVRFLPWSFGLSGRKTGLLLVLSFPFVLAVLHRLSNRRQHALLTGLAGVLLGLCLDHGGLVLGAAVATLAMVWRCERRGTMALALAGLVLASVVTPLAAPWSALRPHRDDTHLRRGVIELMATVRAPRLYPLGAGLGCYQPAINRLRTEIPQQPHPEDNRVAQDGNCQYGVLLVEAGIPGLVGILLFLGLGLLASLRPQPDPDGPDRAAVTSALLGAAFCASVGLLFSRGVGIWTGGLIGLATAESGVWPGAARPCLALGCSRWRLTEPAGRREHPVG
jgi:hypothetical protein